MKKYFLFFLLLIVSTAAYAQQYQVSGYVNDFADIISEQDEAELRLLANNLQESGKAEYAIVTVPSLQGQDIASFSYGLGEGVLGDKEKNNGLLLVVALEDRQYDIEVGRGLEPVIPDIIAGRIARAYLVPNFQQGNYSKGILEASYALQAVINENLDSEYYVDEPDPREELAAVIFFVIFVFMVFLIITLVIVHNFEKEYKKEKKKHKHRDDSDFYIAALVLGNMFKGGGKGGFGGSFGGSGGFGGFGGGSFGGGGARGGW